MSVNCIYLRYLNVKCLRSLLDNKINAADSDLALADNVRYLVN